MSDRDAFRAEQQERRRAGKAKQHEKRLEAATYTAAEVKVLTETAGKVAYALGRKDAGEEIAAEVEYLGVISGSYVADRARNLSSQPLGATSDATSGVPEHQEVSEAVRSPQEPAVCRRCFHTAHDDVGECRVCYCRSATKGNTP